MEQKEIKKGKLINSISYRTNEFYNRPILKKYDRYVPDYKFDSENKKIVIVGKIDFQDKIQSNADSDYRKVFDKFLDHSFFDQVNLFGEQFIENSDEVVESNFLSDKLTDTMNLFELANTYKAKFNLDDNLTPAEVFKKLTEFSEKLKVQNDNDLSNLKSDIEKIGGINNENETT